MSNERFKERLANVDSSVRRLTEAVALPDSELVRDAVIQRFEFTFEAVWKALKLYLEHQGHECGGPRATFKSAFLEKLIPDEDEADIWFAMLNDRNLTTHAYDKNLSDEIYRRIVREYTRLLGVMAERLQKLSWER